MPVIEVARKTAELEGYAARYLEYAASASTAETPEDAEERPPGPEIPAPFRAWLEFLFTLEQRLRQVPDLARVLHADTAAGLRAIEIARERFTREHRRCPECGAWLIRAAGNCICGWRAGKAKNQKEVEATFRSPVAG
jgi:ribosomal protein S27AE